MVSLFPVDLEPSPTASARTGAIALRHAGFIRFPGSIVEGRRLMTLPLEDHGGRHRERTAIVNRWSDEFDLAGAGASRLGWAFTSTFNWPKTSARGRASSIAVWPASSAQRNREAGG
jgi:hypothetical protein